MKNKTYYSPLPLTNIMVAYWVTLRLDFPEASASECSRLWRNEKLPASQLVLPSTTEGLAVTVCVSSGAPEEDKRDNLGEAVAGRPRRVAQHSSMRSAGEENGEHDGRRELVVGELRLHVRYSP